MGPSKAKSLGLLEDVNLPRSGQRGGRGGVAFGRFGVEWKGGGELSKMDQIGRAFKCSNQHVVLKNRDLVAYTP